MTLFVSNFIGVVFARSLHYQFYVWYFHMLPYLVFSTFEIVNNLDYIRVLSRLCWLGMIEYAFNVYPATKISSIILQVAHFSILYALYRHPAPMVVDDSDVVYKTFTPDGDVLSDTRPTPPTRPLSKPTNTNTIPIPTTTTTTPDVDMKEVPTKTKRKTVKKKW